MYIYISNFNKNITNHKQKTSLFAQFYCCLCDYAAVAVVAAASISYVMTGKNIRKYEDDDDDDDNKRGKRKRNAYQTRDNYVA